MIIVLHNDIDLVRKNKIVSYLENNKLQVREIIGETETILGAVGHSGVDIRDVELLDGVVRVIPISKPYKLASREFKNEDTVFNIGNIKIGGSRIVMMAGPCAVESRDQIMKSAWAVKEAGAVILRGGAFKPRTSPYSFQGLGEEGCKLLREAGDATGLAVATEVVSPNHVDMMTKYIDIFQIGARNMQNFELLKAVGKTEMPVILKRGLSATIEEWLMAAEYLLSSGTEKVILCERGIRTFETYTRNTLDLSAIPVIKKLSHLPIIVDPSHGTGRRDKVAPMALAAIAAGADGLIIEVHPDPEKATSDGAQSLFPDQFEKLVCDVEALAPVVGKEVAMLPEIFDKGVENKSEAIKADKENAIIAFQGVKGAYSEKAAFSYFGDRNMKTLACNTFHDVFKAVLKEEADWGMIPLENSLAGSVLPNYDELYLFPDIVIVGEAKVRVRHNLLVNPGTKIEDIKEITSHPQALSQCAVFIEEQNFIPIPHLDTAGAAADVSKSGRKDIAAIASSVAAEVWGLEILKEGIETNPNNYTRFAVIARDDHQKIENPDKASVMFALNEDDPGALSRCLALFADNSLNMTKLESRPIHGKPWSYLFYVDLHIDKSLSMFNTATKKLKKICPEFRVLGVYKS